LQQLPGLPVRDQRSSFGVSFGLPQAEDAQNEHHYDNQADEINDAVHFTASVSGSRWSGSGAVFKSTALPRGSSHRSKSKKQKVKSDFLPAPATAQRNLSAIKLVSASV
jgi:hypothetical protein